MIDTWPPPPDADDFRLFADAATLLSPLLPRLFSSLAAFDSCYAAGRH